jgi:hypothetical protein
MTTLQGLASKASLAKILKTLKLFSQAETGTENNSILSLELAIIDSVQKTEESPAVPSIKQQENIPPRRVIPEIPPRPAAVKITTPIEPKSSAPPAVSTPPKQPPRTDVGKPPQTAEQPVSASVSPIEINSVAGRLKHEWRHILEQVPPELRKSPALAILRSTGVQPVDVDKGVIVLSFRYAYLKENWKSWKISCKKVLSNFIGQNCRVQCVLENNHLVKEALKMGAEIIDVEES